MKRLCLILAFLFLFTQTASAMPLLIGQKVVYRGTVTGLRISSVDGTAFIDNAGATIPTLADGNHIIEIYDSAGRFLRGYLKAAGSSETVTDLVTGDDSTFASDTGWWEKGTGVTISGGLLNVDGSGSANQNIITNLAEINPAGKLYKINITANRTSGYYKVYVGSYTDTGTVLSSISNHYMTSITAPTGDALAVYNASTKYTGTFDDLTIAQVTAPSSAGATIVSTKGGTTYNFAYRNASFTWNAASYYVVIKEAK